MRICHRESVVIQCGMSMPSRRYEEQIDLDPLEIEVMLRDALTRWGIETTGDQRVFEDAAARLLQYSPLYLRNLRMEGRAPRHVKVAGRVGYRVRDIALWIVEKTEVG